MAFLQHFGGVGCAAYQGLLRQSESSLNSPNSKWGRHCCRPHSHRCVVMSEDRNLASDVFPFGCPKASVRFFHRRSHRHPAPPSCLPGRVRQVQRPSLLSQADHQWAAPRSRFPLVADCLERLHRRSGQKTFSSGASSAFDRVGPIHETRPLRSVIDPLASDRSVQHAGLGKHMDSFFHVFPVWNFS